jgi:mono/diheme cytochrome c family protein
MLVDYGMGLRGHSPDPSEEGYVRGQGWPVVNLTPQVFIGRRVYAGWQFAAGGKSVHQALGKGGRLYTHPYPIGDNAFLVACKARDSDHYQDVANAYGLYVIDTVGNQRLLHADAELSCWHPTPLVARPVPPRIDSHRDAQLAARGQALCVVADIYHGMEGVGRGQVKWLRINEALPRYWSSGRRWSPSLASSNWKAALWPRVQWGVVPVEADGSAQFVVPSGRNIFYQALDESFREVQRERTYVNYAPGEVRSCTGCHGQANRVAPGGTGVPLALRRAPSTPQPQPCDDGAAGQVIHYPTDIQPIFDARCVQCHGAKEPAGGLRLTGEVTTFYNTSYEELARKELAGPIIAEFDSFGRGDQGNYNGAYLPPRSLGCAKSVLMAVLTDRSHAKNARDDHSRMLNPRELMVLGRWVDTNYQFYGSYFGRQHPQWTKRDPKNAAYDPGDFRRKATFEEATGFLAPPWHR